MLKMIGTTRIGIKYLKAGGILHLQEVLAAAVAICPQMLVLPKSDREPVTMDGCVI